MPQYGHQEFAGVLFYHVGPGMELGSDLAPSVFTCSVISLDFFIKK